MADMDEQQQEKRQWFREERAWTFEELEWLRSDEGRAVCRAMMADQPADTPAAVDRWRQRLEPDKVAAAWAQTLLRRQARAKFARADDMLFDRIALEQATDECVAGYKAARFEGLARAGHLHKIADLCCGIGGDAIALSSVAETIALDWSRIRVAMAEYNAAVHDRAVFGLVADVAGKLPDADAVHIDPDRRVAGRRRHQLQDSSPSLDILTRICTRYRQVAIKLSPGTDFSALPAEGELELISHGGQCKQAVLWTGALQRHLRSATALPHDERITADSKDELRWPDTNPVLPDHYIYEPDAAVIRANLVGPLARRYELAPIDPRIAYLVGHKSIASGLMARFRVIDMMEWSAKKVRQWLTGHDVGKIDIKTRGFAARPEDVRKQLKSKGTRPATLFLTRIGDKPMAILTQREK